MKTLHLPTVATPIVPAISNMSPIHSVCLANQASVSPRAGTFRPRISGLYLIAVLAGFCGTASATTTLFSSNFEAPTYAPGTLSGQNGWFNTGSGWGTAPFPVVEQATTFAGAQALEFGATGATGQAGQNHSLSYSLSGNSETTVTIDIEALLTSAGTASDWDMLGLFSSNGFLAQLTVLPNGNATLGLQSSSVGSVPVSRDTWNLFQLSLNFTTQVVTASVNGQNIGAGPFANGPVTNLTDVGLGINSSPGTDTAYFDNLSVVSTAAPEPSAMLLLSIGAVAFLFSARKRQVRV